MSGISSAMANARRGASESVTKFKAAARFGAKAGGPENEAPTAANESASPRLEPSVISANTQIDGSISTTDELYVQGRVEGDVRATSVIVCEGGMVRGDIKADSIAVYGVVTGNLNGGHVLLCAGSMVDGEIRHAGLGIDSGANFEGTIRRVATEAPAAAE
jgi:cytoskeletal protein CcmA (bactofilin family)